jgi:hypothetical protein
VQGCDFTPTISQNLSLLFVSNALVRGNVPVFCNFPVGIYLTRVLFYFYKEEDFTLTVNQNMSCPLLASINQQGVLMRFLIEGLALKVQGCDFTPTINENILSLFVSNVLERGNNLVLMQSLRSSGVHYSSMAF